MTLEAEREDRGELELPEDGHDLWLLRVIRSVGYRNVPTFAAAIGVPKVTAYQCVHGSAKSPPTHRPPARLLLVIADALKVPVTDLLEKLWGEKDGDACPCGCGGKKSFKHTPPHARTLAIVIPCAKCGTTENRIHKRWKKGRHRKLCPKCAITVDLIDRICSTCGTSKPVKPHIENARLRRVAKGLSPKEWQCRSCTNIGAPYLKRHIRKKLLEILKGKHPDKNTKTLGKIRTVGRERELRKRYHKELSPKFKAEPKDQEKGRRNFAAAAAAGKTFPKMTKANLLRRWSMNCAGCKHDPHPHVRCQVTDISAKKRCVCRRYRPTVPKMMGLGLCNGYNCGTLEMSHVSKNPDFHWSCHNSWEGTPAGREFQSRKVNGKKTKPLRKPGGHSTSDSLKISYLLLVQHYLGKKSFRDLTAIGRSLGAVEERIKFLTDRLPNPELMGSRFRPAIELLLHAAGKPLPPRPSTHSELTSQPLARL
jgi:hypothetical protein